MKFFITLFIVFFSTLTYSQKQISGYITDQTTGEALIGVSVYSTNRTTGTVSNPYGYFTLRVSNNDSVFFQYLGYETGRFFVLSGQLNVQLKPVSGELKTAKVIAAKTSTPAFGSVNLDMKHINNLPVAGGERDLIKSVQLLPGIKKGADGTASMLVRGGVHDQNLILLDDAHVYNPSHLLGFFSLFNTDAIKDAKLHTGGFSANYGGRLSSVLDIHTNEGNTQKLKYSGSAGILASRLAAEGPLFKGKGSFLAATRISYVNKVFELAGKELPFYFYDVNVKMNYRISEKDKIFLGIYNGDDILYSSKSDSAGNIKVSSKMGNTIASLRWAHAFTNKKLFSSATLFNSNYRYRINGGLDNNFFAIQSGIYDLGGRYTLSHQWNNRMCFKYGGEYISHTFNPNSTRLNGNFNENLQEKTDGKQVMNEGAFFLTGDFYVSQKTFLQAGMRYSFAQNNSIIYHHPEPRFSLSHHISEKHAVSLSYARMVQYMFLLSSSSAVLPTDLWCGISTHIKPQQADVFSAGYQFKHQSLTSKAEVYYKPMNNLVDYKEGTTDFNNTNADENIVQGTGKAYGFELSNTLSKEKLQITFTYTLSWSTRTFNALNQGETFFARYDRRHDLNVIASYRFSKRIQMNAVWCYATGSMFTPVIGHFMMPNGNYTNIDFLPVYSGKNAVLLAASHRLDVNLTIKNNPDKKYQAEWQIGAYNAYNQTQPYRIKMNKNADGSYTYKQMGLFGFVPSITYLFKF